MILIFALACRENSGNVGGLLEIYPQPAHGVVHAGEYFHRRVARIVAHKLFVDFKNPFQFAVENLAVDVGEVEINHRLAVDAEVVLKNYLEDGSRSNVARNQVAVLGIPLFQKIPALTLRNGVRIASVAGLFRNPYAAAFAARRFRHEPQLVFAGDAGGMHLNKFAIGIVAALLIKSGLRRTCTYNRIGGLAEDRAIAAGGDDDCIGRECTYFHAAQVHGADAAAHAASVEHRGEKFPVLEFLHLAFGFIAANLLVERVKKLLAGGRSRKGGAVIERSAEAAKIEQPLRRSVEGNTHAVEQINDAGRGLAHVFDGRLVGKKITAVNRVVKVLPGRIAFALQILSCVDAALRAYRVRTLHRDDGEEIDVCAHLRNLDNGGKPRQAATNDNDFWNCHLSSTGLPYSL